MPSPLTVELGSRSYPIHIDAGLAPSVRAYVDGLLEDGRKVAVVTDATVAAAQPKFFSAAFGLSTAVMKNAAASDFAHVAEPETPGTAAVSLLTLPAGETTKSTEHLARLWDFLAAARLDRTSVLVAVGGGVIGDLAGFAAASYLRGIAFVQVPTTLLAMVDSSVGGKTGINLAAGKNLVGAFHQPAAVFADTALLETLPAREFAAGMAEVIKYGLLADYALFQRLSELGKLSPRHPALADIVARCCAIKADIVKADETEQAASGGRALLNLGHTFAHALENVSGYGRYLHGEAVAIGLLLATRLSVALGHLPPEDVEVVRALLATYGLPTGLHRPVPVAALLAAMKSDKKVHAGRLRFVVMEKLGHAVTVEGVDLDLVRDLWTEAGATSVVG